MENTKYFLKSKRFWGAVLTAIGFGAIIIGQFFGHDYKDLYNAIGTVFQLVGIPMATYGGAVAEKPLGFKQNKYV